MPRVLHLFNVLGALTERAMLDYTLGLSRAAFALTLGYETRANDAPRIDLPQVQLKRIVVEPTNDVDAQMNAIAEHPADPALRSLLKQDFNLLHGHFGPRILQGAAFVKRGIPMLVSVYGYDVGRLLRDPCWAKRYLWAAGQGVTFVALAQFMERRLLDIGLPRQCVRRIHLGIDLPAHQFEPMPAPASPRFVFIGRFVEKKGTSTLIDAMSQLDGATLDLIGGGPLENSLREQVARLKIEDRVNFIGTVPFEKLFDHLRGCTAIVQPSVVASDGDAEGAPMVLMTAQACGVPCITTQHSGNPETIPPAGQRFVVPERNAQALAAAMRQMIELPPRQRAELQTAGRAWIAEHFNLANTVQQYAQLYRELLAQPRRDRAFQ